MKKFFKWAAIISGAFILVAIIAGIFLYKKYYGFGTQFPSGGPLSKNQANIDIKYYDINLRVDADNKWIGGFTNIVLKTRKRDLDTLELDLIENYHIDSLLVFNRTFQSFSHKKNKLYVHFGTPIPSATFIKVHVAYSGNPPEAVMPPWQGGINWSKDADGNFWVGLSCQGEGAKIWFPCKDNPSDEPDSAAINITVPKGYFVASNGLLDDVDSADGFKTFHWSTHYPINNYDINFGMGKYKRVTGEYITEKRTIMPVVFYVLAEDEKKGPALVKQAIDMLYTYRKYFGEYPWVKEKFGLLQTDYLGMEHQTINAYGNNFKNLSFDGLQFDELMLHEMGHEWWGNKVTVRDWADFWIHEGICTYGEALYVLDKAGEKAYYDYMQRIKKRITNKKPVVAHKNATTTEAYNSDIYSKGAAFMNTLRYVLGDSIFFKTLKQFATDSSFTYQNQVVTADLINLVNKNSGHDYSDLFHLYLYSTDLPVIKIDSLQINRFQVSIPNIDFTLPMDVEFEDSTKRMDLGPRPIIIHSAHRPIIDPKNWYLKKEFN